VAVMPNTVSNSDDRHEITNNTQVLKEVAKMPTKSTYLTLATVSSYTESTYSDSKPTYFDVAGNPNI